MKRRDFLKTTAAAGAALTVAGPLSAVTTSCCNGGDKDNASCAPCCMKDTGAVLNLGFQEWTAPQKELAERLDWMESLGVVGFEPSGNGLLPRVNELQQALNGRNIHVSAICAGFKGFILSEDPVQKKDFDTSFREILDAAGQLGSTGVIMVPAFNSQKPCMPHNQETRDYLVEELRSLGDYAQKCGTTVILEPLNRAEAFYLRLVADAAAICRDVNNPGVTCLGDFWHMKEETSDFAAFLAAGKYLQHVHMASRGTRNTPGEDGEVDNYVDGFRGLKAIGYNKYVSFECGCKGDKLQALPAAVELLRRQWEEA